MITNLIKKAVFARLYSAGEIKLGLLMGSYPPPHKEIDEYINNNSIISICTRV